MNNRIRSLEGLRGAAALLVVLLHSGLNAFPPIDNGYLAVDLFFVLSGFVIGGAYGGMTRGAQVGAFVVRRFGRLWPLHAVTVALYFATFVVMTRSAAVLPSPAEALALAAMTHGLNLFDHAVGPIASWSAADELYVYLAFALVCLFTRRGKGRIATLAGLALLGYGIALWMSLGPATCLSRGRCFDLSFSFGWSRCVAGFFLGALMAEVNDDFRLLAGRTPQMVSAGLLVLLLSLAGRVPALACIAPLACAAFVASLASDSGPVARFFHAGSFQYLGRVSYSLYLGHGVLAVPYVVALKAAASSPVALLAVVLAFFVVSVSLAHVLNRLVETPCRRRFNAYADTAFRSSAAPATLEPEPTAHLAHRTAP